MKAIKDKGDFRLRKEISKSHFSIIAILTFVIIFAVWIAIDMSGNVKQMFLPSPLSVINDIVNGAKEGNLWANMGVSIYRISMGFILSVVFRCSNWNSCRFF